MTAPPDPALGVFETLLAVDGRVHALAAHLERLRTSVSELYGQRLPGDLSASIAASVGGLGGPHRVRVDAAPDGDRLTVSLVTSVIPESRPRAYALEPLVLAGGQGRHKWRDRARIDRPSAAAVPLIIDEDGSVLEAAWANVWLLDGDRLITPPADGRILPGVTRARLLERAPEFGLTAQERSITLEEARAAPGLLLSSSLAIVAAAALDGVPSSRSVAAARAAAIHDRLLSERWESPPAAG